MLLLAIPILFIGDIMLATAVVYGAVGGALYALLRLVVPRRIGSRWLLAACGLAAFAIVSAFDAPYLGDRRVFAERERTESGARYYGAIDRPAGIAFAQPYGRALECTLSCQELLFERQVSYVEIVARDKSWQKTRRYSMIVDHERCAPVREYLQTTGKVRPEKVGLAAFSHEFEAAIAIDACLAFEEADQPSAPILILSQPFSPGYSRMGAPTPVRIGDHLHALATVPAYAGKYDTQRSEIVLLKPDGARDRLLASSERSSLEIPLFPPVFMVMPKFVENGWEYRWTQRLFYRESALLDVMNRTLALDLDEKAEMPLAALPALIGRLSDEPKVRKIAARTLVDLVVGNQAGREGYHVFRQRGEENAPLVFDSNWLDPLLRATQDADAAVRTDTFRVIGAFGPQARAALPRVLAALDADTGQPRAAAIEASRRISVSENDVGRMIAALADENWQTRESARHGLEDIGAPAVAPLIAIVADATRAHRGDAMLALSCLGADAEPAVPALLKILSDAQEPTRWDAARALAMLRRPEAVQPMIAAMLSEPHGRMYSDMEVSTFAVSLMGEPAVPALIPLLEHEHGWVRDRAAAALANMGAEARDALPALRTAHQRLLGGLALVKSLSREDGYLGRFGYADLIARIEKGVAAANTNPRREAWRHQNCSEEGHS